MTKEEKNYRNFMKKIAELEIKHGLFITSNGKIQASNGSEVYDLEYELRKTEEKLLEGSWD